MTLIKSFFIFIGFSLLVFLTLYLIVENDKIPQKNVVKTIKINSIINNCKKTPEYDFSILFD